MMQKTIHSPLEWLVELDRIGTAEGLEGFPMQREMFVGENCWLADFEEGLTPRESIDGERPDANPELLRRKRRAEARAWRDAD
jgi:hypothetical protein